MNSNEYNFTPDKNTKIGRYLKLSKFLDLLETGEIHFTNSRYFQDQLEGEIPEIFYDSLDIKNEEQFKISTSKYISCWNEFYNETYALWKIYTGYNDGICITTTVGKLQQCLENTNIDIYKVNYIDFYNDNCTLLTPPQYTKIKNSSHKYCPVWHALKHSPYRYEHEIRAIYIDNSNDKCKRFKINIYDLIDEIYITPFASVWYESLIEKIVRERYNLDTKITNSKIQINTK